MRCLEKLVMCFLVVEAALGRHIAEFAQWKAGGKIGRGKVWHYSGSARNPKTGDSLVSVEGVEQTVLLSRSSSNASYLSQKVFVFRDYRNKRPSEAIAVPTVLTEYVLLGTDEAGRNFVSIERPGHPSLLSRKLQMFGGSDPRQGTSPDFPVNIGDDSNSWGLSLFASGEISEGGGGRGWLHNKWISISPSSRSRHARSQEYYRLAPLPVSFINKLKWMLPFPSWKTSPDTVLKYSRYGECPKWYAGLGADSCCITELSACRYGRHKDLPQGVATLVDQFDPSIAKGMILHLNGTSTKLNSSKK